MALVDQVPMRRSDLTIVAYIYKDGFMITGRATFRNYFTPPP